MADNFDNNNLSNNKLDNGLDNESFLKNHSFQNMYFKWGLTAFIVINSTLFVYSLFAHYQIVVNGLSKFAKIMMPVIDGFIIAYLLSPIINKIESFIKNKKDLNKKQQKRIRVLNIVLVLLLFIFILYELFSLVIPEITANILSIKDNSTEYLNNLDNMVNNFYTKYPELGKNIDQLWNDYSDKIYDWVNLNFMPKISTFIMSLTTGIFSALKAVWNFIIGLIISIYFMYNKELFIGQIKKLVYAFFKKDMANTFIHNARFTNKTFNGFIVGKLIDSFIIGCLCYISTIIIGTPYPLLISIIVGVTNIIPFFGPFIGAIPCTLLILLIDPIQCLYFIILIVVLQQIDGNILGPKILGDSTGLTGFWVIFAITLFGGLWGVLGMIVGVPLFAVIYAWFSSFIKIKLELKGLNTNTNVYKDVDYIDSNNEFLQVPKEEISRIVSVHNINKLKTVKYETKSDNKDNEEKNNKNKK